MVVDIYTVFGDTLEIDVEGALFVCDRCHVVNEVLGAYTVNVMEHHPKRVWGFVMWYLMSYRLFGQEFIRL